MKQYTFAMIGTGIISKYFAGAVVANNHKLVGVSKKSSTPVAYDLPKETPIFTDYQEMLRKTNPDVVIIATPNDTHYDMVKTCLEAGKHVLCEKPLTITPKEAKELITLAEKQHVLLMTVFHRRYNKNVVDLFDPSFRDQIAVVYARYLENIPDHSSREEWFKDVERTGGGCVIDNGINVIDVIRYMVGEVSVESAHIGYKKEGDKQYDQNAFITLNHAQGKAFIALDWHYPGEIKDLTIYLKNGEVIYRDMLAGSEGFKSSLWHEYEIAIAEAVAYLEKGEFPSDIPSLRSIELVSDIYTLEKKR